MTGHAGPNHATATAELAILRADLASHRVDEIALNAGQSYRIFRAIPRGPAPAQGWPVLYCLDANAVFDRLTPTLLEAARGLVVIGVGYQTERQFAREIRTLEFTPPERAGAEPSPDPVHEGRLSGGAEGFLARLTGPIRQAAETGLCIDEQGRGLFGHSFGGLFTLFARLSAPQSFARYAAISPSLWWCPERIARVKAEAARACPPLLIALGDREKRTGSEGPPPDGPAPATLEFIADLPDVTLHILKDHVHIQTLGSAIPLAFAQNTPD